MQENFFNNCRTCLKEGLKMNPLSMIIKGYKNKPTYSKLLQESVKLESLAEHEDFMPQQICILCCKELRKAYTFIQKTQNSNKILMSFVEKQLSTTTQKPSDIPESKLNAIEENSNSQLNAGISDIGVSSTEVLLTRIKVENENEHDEESLQSEEEFCDIKESDSSKNVDNSSEAQFFQIKTLFGNELVETTDHDNREFNKSPNAITEQNLDNFNTVDLKKEIIATNETTTNEFLEDENMEDAEKSQCTDEMQTLNKTHSCDLPLENSLLAENMQNINCFKVKSEDNEEHVHIFEVIEVESKTSSFVKASTNKESSVDQREELEEAVTTDSEHFQIKIEETQIEMHKTNKNDEMNKNRKEKPVKCPSCDHVAKNRFRLSYHKRTVHLAEEDKLKCQFCSFTHSFKRSLLTHMKRKHKQLITTLKAKATKNIESSPRNCNASTSTFSKQMSSIQQEKDEGSDEEEGEFSSDASTEKKLKHAKTNPKIQNEQQSSDEEFIKNLLNIKKGTQPKKKCIDLLCDKCGKSFNYYDALYSHKQMHKTEEEQLPCPYCKKKFKRKSNLKNHVRRIHHEHIPNRKIPEKRFMCEHCNFVTKTRVHLKLHVRTRHTGERPFKCDQCSKSFVRKHDLKLHCYSHVGITFKCDICEKNFANDEYLRMHKRRHNREERACQDCGKLIKDIKRHKRNCMVQNN